MELGLGDSGLGLVFGSRVVGLGLELVCQIAVRFRIRVGDLGLASVCESASELWLESRFRGSGLGWDFGFRVWGLGLASVCQIALGFRASGWWSTVGVCA